MVEVVVAMVVFGIALTGLFPLLAIMSRDLQPIKKIDSSGTATYRCETPARDGNIDGADFSPVPNFEKHVWYVAPSTDPWVRKLGAGAQWYSTTMSAATAPAGFTASASPIPIGAPFAQQDDDEDADAGYVDSFTDSDWVYNASASAALGADCHRHDALPAGSAPTAWATWTLTVPVAGWYSVQATWPFGADQVTDAVYSVSVNGTPLTSVVGSVNQTSDPEGVEDDDGTKWAGLTTAPIQLAAGATVQVQLHNVRASSAVAGKFVVADGARIVRNEVKVVSLDRSLKEANSNRNNADITARVAVKVNIPQ
jgi:hypothetical protein